MAFGVTILTLSSSLASLPSISRATRKSMLIMCWTSRHSIPRRPYALFSIALVQRIKTRMASPSTTSTASFVRKPRPSTFSIIATDRQLPRFHAKAVLVSITILHFFNAPRICRDWFQCIMEESRGPTQTLIRRDLSTTSLWV